MTATEYLEVVLAQLASTAPYIADVGAALGRMVLAAILNPETWPFSVGLAVFCLCLNQYGKGTTAKILLQAGLFGGVAAVLATVIGMVATGSLH